MCCGTLLSASLAVHWVSRPSDTASQGLASLTDDPQQVRLLYQTGLAWSGRSRGRRASTAKAELLHGLGVFELSQGWREAGELLLEQALQLAPSHVPTLHVGCEEALPDFACCDAMLRCVWERFGPSQRCLGHGLLLIAV